MSAGNISVVALCWVFTLNVPTVSIASVERDPFRPAKASGCDNRREENWHLRGVMGNSTRWIGWLATPESPWVRVQVGETVPATRWRVIHLDPHHIRLEYQADNARCPGLYLTRTLLAPPGSIQRKPFQ